MLSLDLRPHPPNSQAPLPQMGAFFSVGGDATLFGGLGACFPPRWRENQMRLLKCAGVALALTASSVELASAVNRECQAQIFGRSDSGRTAQLVIYKGEGSHRRPKMARIRARRNAIQCAEGGVCAGERRIGRPARRVR